MRTNRFLILLLVCGLWCCKPAQVSTSSVAPAYQEELSIHRPAINTEEIDQPTSDEDSTYSNVRFTGHIKTEMDSVNKMIAARNKELGYIDGYTIQVYTGTDRELADQALEMVESLYAQLEPEITYRQPSYKVKIGHYTNRLEAHALLQSLKTQFPRALMIPERISKTYE